LLPLVRALKRFQRWNFVSRSGTLFAEIEFFLSVPKLEYIFKIDGRVLRLAGSFMFRSGNPDEPSV